jgi:HSP20 family protein
MTPSFFEKLTGASDDEEKIEVSEKIPEEKPKKIKSISKKSKVIKKNSLDVPQSKNRTEKVPIKEPEPKEIEPIEEEKGWLEEEEGQLTLDVYQTDADIVIKSTVAGVSPEDIDIGITNDMVTIRGKRKRDEKIETESYYYQELYWGAFSRSVILPVEVDADRAKATIKNGILTIRLPKSEKSKTKKIKVKPAE